MFFNLDIKLILAIIAGAITIISYFPYVKDIFARKTKPHAYTWLIWAITQGTAATAVIYGGGDFGATALIVGTILVIFIFFLSFKYGSKDITKGDTVTLFFALLAIVIWWLLDSPYIAIFLITLIDIVGYIPTLRKTHRDPKSETFIFWFAMVVVNALVLISVAEHNFLTMAYPFMLFIMNIIMSILIIVRRRQKIN